jgi:hypothetical protein
MIQQQVEALQNALVVKDAEAYFRAMFRGGDVSAWNIRDRHMFDVIVGGCLLMLELHAVQSVRRKHPGFPAQQSVVVVTHSFDSIRGRYNDIGGPKGTLQ